MADLATLQTQLLEAQLALHKLAIGSKAEEVQHADMRTRYMKADMGKLEDYIASLKSQIVAAGGTSDGMRRTGFVVDLPGHK